MPYQMGDFRISGRFIRYSTFVPRFYNLCKSYGFTPGKIMPSRAFCSDESQGYPIILIAKHFGTFPFNHGRVGGIVATDRHGPHSHHGKDMVIIQASHVGYNPETGHFGSYRRLQLGDLSFTPSCGKIGGVMVWYQKEYEFARENVIIAKINGEETLIIDNQLLSPDRETGLFLNLEKLIEMGPGGLPKPSQVFSTAKSFRINPDFKAQLPNSFWEKGWRSPIADLLTADLFYYKRDIIAAPEGQDHLEYNLSRNMPYIVTSTVPALSAAQANTQIEFDRTYRTIIGESGYQGKNLAFIAGINIDISPNEGQRFPLTKFVPWAAYVQTVDGNQFVLEQDELFDALVAQSGDNPDKIDLTHAIHAMEAEPEVIIELEQ